MTFRRPALVLSLVTAAVTSTLGSARVPQSTGADAAVTIGEALGPAAETALRDAYTRERADYEKEWKGTSQECIDQSKFDPTVWWISRTAGTWITHGASENARYCNYGFDYDVEIDVSRITGRADDRARWQTLSSRRPDLIDVRVSPGGRWSLAWTRQELLVFDGNAMQPALSLPFKDNHPVMVEWATGRNVARWDVEVRRVRAMGAVSPLVVTK